jgi:uncharacterized protein Yka (UPF0111/DUF47 family)
MQSRVDSALTPEERAQLMQIQDRLIELFADRGDALASGDQENAEAMQDEIDDLLRQRDDIKSWAAGAR